MGKGGRCNTADKTVNVLLGGCDADCVGIGGVGMRGGFGHFVGGGPETPEVSRDHSLREE